MLTTDGYRHRSEQVRGRSIYRTGRQSSSMRPRLKRRLAQSGRHRRQQEILRRRRILRVRAQVPLRDELARQDMALAAAAGEELAGRASWLAALQDGRSPVQRAERVSWYRDLIAGWTGDVPLVWPIGPATVAASSLPFFAPAGIFQAGVTVQGPSEEDALALLCDAVCAMYSLDAREGEFASEEARVLTAMAAQSARHAIQSSLLPTRIDLLEAAHPVEEQALEQLIQAYGARQHSGTHLYGAHEARFRLSFDYPHLPPRLRPEGGQVRLQVLILDLLDGDGQRTCTLISLSESTFSRLQSMSGRFSRQSGEVFS
jgi:hypothetical protein